MTIAAATPLKADVYLGDMRFIVATAVVLCSFARMAFTQTPPQEQPLPDPIALMREVEATQKKAELLVKDYTFRSSSTTEQLNGKGAVKKTETEEREFFVDDGVPVSRLVSKNGKPLTPEEDKKEEEHVRKEIAKAKERKAKAKDSGKEVNSRGEDELSLARILELGTFSNERRSVSGGRSSILLDYRGNKDAKTDNATEKAFQSIFKDLSGTLTVDEATYTLTHLEAQFQTDFHIGGGLVASVSKGTHFSYSATRINDEIWLPSEISGEGSARFLLLAHFDGRLHMHFSNYKRFAQAPQYSPK